MRVSLQLLVHLMASRPFCCYPVSASIARCDYPQTVALTSEQLASTQHKQTSSLPCSFLAHQSSETTKPFRGKGRRQSTLHLQSQTNDLFRKPLPIRTAVRHQPRPPPQLSGSPPRQHPPRRDHWQQRLPRVHRRPRVTLLSQPALSPSQADCWGGWGR